MKANTESPEKKTMSEIISLIQFDISPSLTEEEVNLALNRIKSQRYYGNGFALNRSRRSGYIKYSIWTSVVAMVLMISWVNWPWKSVDTFHNSDSRFSTLPGESALVKLPDGSEVLLNVSSVLSVPSSFGITERKVNLIGEAYFRIKSSSRMAFTVSTPHSTAKVLGTEFVVSDYSDDGSGRVAVKSGRVMVGEQIVSAGERIIWRGNDVGAMARSSKADFAFVNGELMLDDMTLGEAIPVLNRWYDIEILLGSDSLKEIGIGGTMAKGSIQDLATILKMTYKINAVIDGKTLTLYRN